MKLIPLAAFFLTAAVLTASAAAQSALPASPPHAAPLPVNISPLSFWVRTSVRWHLKPIPVCEWPASRVTLRVEAKKVNVRLMDTGDGDAFEVVVDGKPYGILTATAGTHLYRIFQANMTGIHLIQLVKRTEAFVGTAQLQGFQLSKEGRILPPPAPSGRRIELVGDSISCGYGDEAASQTQHFTPATENAYLSYGAIAARAFDAQFADIAWSGKLMWPHNTMNALYGYILPASKSMPWNFASWMPQAVIINLSTNDFAQGIPSRRGWMRGYKAFIARVRKHYPKAVILCASSPMLWGSRNIASRTWLHSIVEQENAEGDHNVHYLRIATQSAADGYGADWHPSLKTHRIMAGVVIAALQKYLGWKPVQPSHTP